MTKKQRHDDFLDTLAGPPRSLDPDGDERARKQLAEDSGSLLIGAVLTIIVLAPFACAACRAWCAP